MSDIIQLLPDSVANQIAAGEVIQRPSSVVKELMENAIDAGADHIQVLITDAGRTAIQVLDNGKGMSDTDARLAFERHATSKIRQATDLFSLQTMGFRGEALPSIAAVAQVEVKTRQNDTEMGTHLTIEASRVKSQQPTVCPAGCNIKVQNLFFNLPARRKFLKSNQTEFNHIVQTFQRIVLVYPHITFHLSHNEVELYHLTSGTQLDRIADVFGKKCRQDLLPIKTSTSLCTLTGYVGKPESARKRGVPQFFFTNGRYMRHPYFHKAVAMVYDRLIPQGEQTPYYIYIDIDPSHIDVNIHPTKTEIKFEDEQAIWQLIGSAVRSAIGRYGTDGRIDFNTAGKPDIPVFHTYGGGSTPPFPDRTAPPAHWDDLYLPPQQPQQPDSLFPEADHTDAVPTAVQPTSARHYQYKGQYIVSGVKSGLMLIDQHRAHLRILYEQYLTQYTDSSLGSDTPVIPTQQLVFPESIELTATEALTLDRLLPLLEGIGFDIRPLGSHTFAAYGIPNTFAGHNLQVLLHDIIAATEEQTGDVKEELLRHVALQLARRTAITTGEVLTDEEMDNIVNRLFRCTDVHHTPDGKPILHIITQTQIDQLFDR